jgi:hypothetical protein
MGTDVTTRVVSHPVFGEGEVLDTRLSASELLVRFGTGLQLWIPAQRVSGLCRPEEKPRDEIQARRMVEAFRLGIVPHQDVEEFTLGREREIKEAIAGLERLKGGEGGVLLVEGEYGAGKTHLLEYVHHRALRMGMVTSRLEFDPVDVAPNRPKRVYRELVHSLRWLSDRAPAAARQSQEEPCPAGSIREVRSQRSEVRTGYSDFSEYGFRDLLRRAVDLPMQDHVFFAPVLDHLRRPARKGKRGRHADLRSEVFWQMLEGESTKEYAVQYRSPYRITGGYSIPALYDFSTAGDFYCYIISGLSHICRELHLHGLVLLIDEAETVTHLWDVIAFARGMNFIEGLIRTAQNDPELKRVDDKLIHNRVRTTPYIYRDARIYLVIATTPEPYDYTYLKMTNHARRRLVLAPLGERALLDAFDKLVTIYQRAYPGFVLPQPEKKRLMEQAFRMKGEGIRYFVKLCIEALDLTRINRRGVDFKRLRANRLS